MSNIYFFTNPAFLAPQDFDDAYGQIPDPDHPSISNSFNVSSMHKAYLEGIPSAQDIPAYAVCAGQVFVQDSDVLDGNGNKLLNIILKPSELTSIGAVNVRYFIYKGILRESILKEEDNILSIADENTNDLTKVIYDYNKKRNLTGDASINSIGYNYSTGQANAEANDTLFEDRIFVIKTGSSGDTNFFEFPTIKAGKTIGSFIKDGAFAKIGFEIVLEGTKQQLTFGDVRANKKIISVATNDAVSLAVREKILDYIDPCAYFNSFYFSKDGIKTDNRKQKGIDIYENVIVRFANKNRIYLDIRNENGYSFPYKGYYSDLIKIGDNSTTYSTTSWPIQIINVLDLPVGTAGVNKLKIQLPKGLDRVVDDTESLLYIASGYFGNGYPIKNKKLNKKQDTSRFKKVNYVSSAYSEEIQLAYPANTDGIPLCTYIQLHYIKKNKSYNASAGYKIVPTLTHFDNLFPIREMLLKLPEISNFQTTFIKSYGIKFVDNTYLVENKKHGFSGMMEYGIVYSLSGVVLYAYPVDVYFDGGVAHYNFTKLLGGANNDFFRTLTNRINNIQISRCKMDITGASDAGVVSIESIPNNTFSADYRAKYNFYAIALSKSEFDALKARADNEFYTYANDTSFQKTAGYHNATLVLTDTNIYADNNNKLYIKSNLKISGFNVTNQYFVDPELAYAINLYSSDGVWYCSENFFKTVPANTYSCLSDNKIEFSDIDRGGVIKRLSASPISNKWTLYKTFDAITIDVAKYENETDYYNNPLFTNDIELFAGTRVILLGLTVKKLVDHNDILFPVYRVVCFYNKKFREGWVSQQSLINSGGSLNYLKDTVKIRLTSNDRSNFYIGTSSQTDQRDASMFTFFNDAYMDVEIIKNILSDFEITSGNFFTNLYTAVKTSLDAFALDYEAQSDSQKTSCYDKLQALSNQRDKQSSASLEDVINYENDATNDQTLKYIDENLTFNNFGTKLIKGAFKVIENDKIADYNKVIVIRVAKFWFDKTNADEKPNSGLPSLRQFVEGTAFWREITRLNPARPGHVLSDPQYNSDSSFRSAFEDVQNYLYSRSLLTPPDVLLKSSSESKWLLSSTVWDNTAHASLLGNFDKIVIIQPDFWPSTGEPNESYNFYAFSTDQFVRQGFELGQSMDYKRYLNLDSSYSCVNCNNVFAVFINELTQIDADFIKAGGNTESGYKENSLLSASNVFWNFTKENTFAAMLSPSFEFKTDSNIEYTGSSGGVQGMRLKDFFQRNPMIGMFYLKAFINYLKS